MGAQALESGPGTLGKPRFFGVPKGHPGFPSLSLNIHPKDSNFRVLAKWLQTLPNIFQGEIKENFEDL